jgi:hypothetical protein
VMKCPKCREDIEEWAEICPKCGVPLASDVDVDYYEKSRSWYFRHRLHMAIAFVMFIAGILVMAYGGPVNRTVYFIGAGITVVGLVWFLQSAFVRRRSGR